MTNIAIFVSGSGTNCENIIRHFTDSKNVKIALVLSNRSDAYALVMQTYAIDFIVLAGFLLMIPDFLIHAYNRRMVNLHPALLPKFGGKGMYGHHVHEAVKAAGETETGMTVHWVSSICDGGEIIAQYRTLINPEDTPDDIAAKEHILEQKYFPTVIEQVLQSLNSPT